MKVWVFLLFFLGLSCDMYGQQTVKFITYNIRYDNADDGEDAWEHRKEGLGSFLAEEDADFIGMQEVLHEQLTFLREFLVTYQHIGVGRDDGENQGEFSPILFNSERWKMIEQETRWLSDSPHEVSKGWDASLPRIVTSGLFKNLETSDSILVYNTHFDHLGIEARKQSVLLLQQFITEDSKGIPYVLLGDFNLEPMDNNYRGLIGWLSDAKEVANYRHEDHIGTYNGFQLKGKFNRRIDYIFTKPGMKVLSYECFELRINGRHTSDHFPIIVNISI